MDVAEIKELHNIIHISNLPSIWANGILSHTRAGGISHVSVASPDVQQRRAKKIIPGGRPLHEYVNLYFDARNPMLYVLKDQHVALCVLRLDPAVMRLPGVVISDRNASSDYARFSKYPDGLKHLDKDMIFAHYWTHPDPFIEMEHKSVKCAEILVPDRIDCRYIIGAYVSCTEGKTCLHKTGVSLSVTMSPSLFFR